MKVFQLTWLRYLYKSVMLGAIECKIYSLEQVQLWNIKLAVQSPQTSTNTHKNEKNNLAYLPSTIKLYLIIDISYFVFVFFRQIFNHNKGNLLKHTIILFNIEPKPLPLELCSIPPTLCSDICYYHLSLETSLICILLLVSRDVHFDKRMVCFLSGLL